MKGPQDRRNGDIGTVEIGDVQVTVKFNWLPGWRGDYDCPGYGTEMDISAAWTSCQDSRRNGQDFYPVLVALGLSDKFDAEVLAQLDSQGAFNLENV